MADERKLEPATDLSAARRDRTLVTDRTSARFEPDDMNSTAAVDQRRGAAGALSTDTLGRDGAARSKRAAAIAAIAVGALALGAIAVGALAIGRVAIGALALKRGHTRSFVVEELSVGRLHVRKLVIDSDVPDKPQSSVLNRPEWI